jgi:hypothetical protein
MNMARPVMESYQPSLSCIREIVLVFILILVTQMVISTDFRRHIVLNILYFKFLQWKIQCISECIESSI